LTSLPIYLSELVGSCASGFKYARDGCCGTGDLEVSVLCNRATPTCSNPDEHIFWDSFHPTSHFYSQLADSFYDFALPILLAPPSP
jgi:phospholipase/lecithinase/hemolysin